MHTGYSSGCQSQAARSTHGLGVVVVGDSVVSDLVNGTPVELSIKIGAT